MAAGIPVLTTTKNDFGELVEDQQNGFLVHDPKNHWEISERILAFYHSSQKKYIGGKSRITRLQLDIDSVVQRMLSIYGRRSIRVYLEDKEVEHGKIIKLLKAGMAAPSACNIQPWEFVVLTERETVDSTKAGIAEYGNYN